MKAKIQTWDEKKNHNINAKSFIIHIIIKPSRNTFFFYLYETNNNSMSDLIKRNINTLDITLLKKNH